jgi:uncharacterized protein involved in exopolysaccharide biosynthesis
MPEQRDGNVGRLIALQKQYQDKQASIQDLERTCVLIQDQIANRKKVLESIAEVKVEQDVVGQTSMPVQPMSNETRLAKARLVLDQLMTRYTEKHPEVKRTRDIIAKLEFEVEKEKSEGNGTENITMAQSGNGGENTGIGNRSTVDPAILQLEAQLKSVLMNIENIKAEKEQEKKVISQYEQWLAATPNREAEWSALTREYAQLKKHYDYLVSQDLEAKSMLNMEKRQKGSQFKIEDPARHPEKPIKPNFMQIMGIAVAAGLGAGLGLSMLLEFFDGSFRDPETLEPTLGIPLLTTVPHIATQAESRRGKWAIFFQIVLLLSGSIAVVTLFAVVWYRGYIVL